jgi:PII-like signaling protein
MGYATGLRARVHVDETDRTHGRPTYHAIVALLAERGIAGVTVLRGIEGFGGHHQVHTTRILRLAESLPVVVEFVDEESKVRAILPEVEALVGGGLIALDPVEYRQVGASGSTGAGPGAGAVAGQAGVPGSERDEVASGAGTDGAGSAPDGGSTGR